MASTKLSDEGTSTIIQGAVEGQRDRNQGPEEGEGRTWYDETGQIPHENGPLVEAMKPEM